MRAAALLVALCLALPLASASAQDRSVRLPDQRRIHLVCTGSGKATAILESGFGADSGAWYKVQPKLAQTMRVCSYDRAGSGHSDPGPFPRDGQAIARDLDQALKAAKIKGPFIGVGHSSGGLYIRLFAARRPGEVKGLVLVDPSFEHASGPVTSIRDGALLCLHFVEKVPVSRTDPLWNRCIDKNPDEQKTSLSPYKWTTQVSEIETLFTTTSDQVVAAYPKVRDIPTIILSAGDGTYAAQGPAHTELKGKFSKVEQRMVASGHLMFFDAPDAIVAAVNDLARR